MRFKVTHDSLFTESTDSTCKSGIVAQTGRHHVKFKKTPIFVLPIILLMAGCAQVWVKPTARPGEFESDRHSCLQQSQQRVGVAQVNAYGGSSVNTVETNNLLFKSCMNSKGWSLQNQDVAQAQFQQQRLANQQRAEIIKDDFANNLKLVRENCARPELKEYYSKSACLSSEITFAQLADGSYITEEQKAVLLIQREFVAETRKLLWEINIKHYGNLGRKRADFAKSYLDPKEEANNLDLYNKKITWGQYNKVRKEISADFDLRIKDLR